MINYTFWVREAKLQGDANNTINISVNYVLIMYSPMEFKISAGEFSRFVGLIWTPEWMVIYYTCWQTYLSIKFILFISKLNWQFMGHICFLIFFISFTSWCLMTSIQATSHFEFLCEGNKGIIWYFTKTNNKILKWTTGF